jgi:hypothetical protein
MSFFAGLFRSQSENPLPVGHVTGVGKREWVVCLKLRSSLGGYLSYVLQAKALRTKGFNESDFE